MPWWLKMSPQWTNGPYLLIERHCVLLYLSSSVVHFPSSHIPSQSQTLSVASTMNLPSPCFHLQGSRMTGVCSGTQLRELRSEYRDSCMLDKHSTNRTTQTTCKVKTEPLNRGTGQPLFLTVRLSSSYTVLSLPHRIFPLL